MITHRIYLPSDLAGQFDLLLVREPVLDRQARRAKQKEDIATRLPIKIAIISD